MGFLVQAMRKCAEHCTPGVPDQCVPDDAVISHYGKAGTDPEFKHAPDTSKEPGLSVQGVEKTAAEMCALVHGAPSKSNLARARVRLTTAGALRQAGFAVIHTPGRFSNQKNHVTVAWPPNSPFDELSKEWPETVSEAFDACFNA